MTNLMIDTEVSLYLASRARLARLRKVVAFAALPRANEFVKLRNREQGDYFAFTVVQVTHREGGFPEVWLRLISVVETRSFVDLFEDGELDQYVASYVQEGWTLESLVPNRALSGGSAEPNDPPT